MQYPNERISDHHLRVNDSAWQKSWLMVCTLWSNVVSVKAQVVFGALFFIFTVSASVANPLPPTAPVNLTALALSSTEIRLDWEPPNISEGVLFYQVSRDGVVLDSPEETQFTDTGLQAGRYYRYSVVASDGVNFSRPVSFTLGTLEEGITLEPGLTESVAASETSLPSGFSLASSPTGGVPAGWQLVFSDEFDGTGPLDIGTATSNWRFEKMQGGLHRAGNTGIDADGNIISESNSVRGKRWSAWYNAFNAENARRDGGHLMMKGFDSGEVDPTRPVDYYDNGIAVEFGSSKLYTAWLDTFARTFDNATNGFIVDPTSPAKAFKYGYFEASVDFSQIRTPGFRLSMWLMPAASDALNQNLVMDKAYDNDGDNGVEIDIFEYEWINAARANNLQVALIGGDVGGESFGADDLILSALGIDLTQGFHTVGLLWEADRIEWSVDGFKIFEITDPLLIPDVYSYLILSREMNSGVKRMGTDSFDDTDEDEVMPFIPRDPGLFANNIWQYRDRLATDQARIDYIRIWQP